MTTQTEALKMALEALKTAQNNLAPSKSSAHSYGDGELWDKYADAITAIELLAQQSNEQVEPVARIDYWPSAESDRYIANIVAWEHLPVGTLLYTHPPVPTAQPNKDKVK